MWAFEKFPAVLRYSEECVGEVEVFGYVSAGRLIAFRVVVDFAFEEGGDVRLLPIAEFEEKYRKFKLV